MNYTEMLFNRDERLVNLLNQADNKNLELIVELNKKEDEIERLKSIINKSIEFIYENAYNEERTYQVDDLWYEIPKLLEILNKGE